MINVKHKLYIENGCKKIPSFNLRNEKKPLYCSKHKKDNMVQLNSKTCIENGCITSATFNLPNEKTPKYCVKHKKENMINIIAKRCIHDECIVRSTFNFINEITPLYCFKHKKTNMIDVTKKLFCAEKNCKKSPSFNVVDEKKPLYCSNHKKYNMVNIVSKCCIEDKCTKSPNFNIPTETNALYCFEHKKDNMINIKSNKCQHSKCKENKMYGFKNKKPQFCSKHKQNNMINLILENKCSILNCENEHEFIVENTKYCLDHCPNKNYEINIKRLCRYCDIKEESKYICNDCKKVQNKKEWSIVRYLRKNINTQFEYNSSKMLQGCSKKRPDIYFELNKHCVIVEVDENQHNTYEDSCECSRINEIVNGIGGKSVIIIRYNPDIIKNKNKKINISNLEKIDLLVETIKTELIKDYDKFIVKIIQLYYDDNYVKYKPIKEEDITKIVCV